LQPKLISSIYLQEKIRNTKGNRGGGDDDGNRYGGGKNSQHANRDAISSAESRLKEAVIERDKLKSITNNTCY
jgi:hypothetical protein